MGSSFDEKKKNALPTVAFLDLEMPGTRSTIEAGSVSMDCEGQCLSGCKDACITVSN